MKKIFLCLFAIIGLVAVEGAEKADSLTYFVHQETKNPTENRESWMEITINPSQMEINYREAILGSKKSPTQELRYKKALKFSSKDLSRLFDDLKNLGVLSLQESSAKNTTYHSYLDVSLGKETKHFNFETPPSGSRVAIDETILSWAKDKMDLSGGAPTPLLTESDTAPALLISIDTLLANPDYYQGKRVSVSGYGSSGYEWTLLRASKAEGAGSLWVGSLSTLSDATFPDHFDNAGMIIDGIFLKGPTGHMGASKGEITRITRIQPLSK